ncbi:MAG: hypothetical protein ACOH2F_03595 [Cellulomonas sp.]
MLSVGDHRELQAAVLALKAADKSIRNDISRATRAEMNPVWRELVSEHLSGTSLMTGRVLGSGVRIAAGNPPVAKAAQSTRGIGQGKRINPSEDYPAWEFGVVDRNAYSKYRRRNRKAGGTHEVERRTMRALPRRVPKGRIVYPAFKEIAPRMVSLWVQIIVRKYAEALEGNR